MLFGQKNIARYISAQQQNYILRNDANMYIRLIRNEAKGNAISGRLVIDGRWFCYTLERNGVEIPALCYHVCVTQSPRFKRLLPIVQNVPQRSGIRFHRGSKPEHSTGCILVVADNINDNTDNLRGSSINDNIDNLRPNQIAPHSPKRLIGDPAHPLGAQGEYSSPRQEVRGPRKSKAFWGAFDCRGNNRSNECEIRTLSKLSSNKKNIGCRSAADVENQLTQLLLQTQDAHEEIILEVTDFRAGTEYGYNTPCPSSILETTSFSDDC